MPKDPRIALLNDVYGDLPDGAYLAVAAEMGITVDDLAAHAMEDEMATCDKCGGLKTGEGMLCEPCLAKIQDGADPEKTWAELLSMAREMKEAGLPEDDPRVTEWLESRPPEIRAMVLSHPSHQLYRVKPGAPYSGTHPGAIGTIMAYTECTEGQPGAFALKFGMLRAAPDSQYLPIYAHVDAEWLEPVTLEEIEQQVLGLN